VVTTQHTGESRALARRLRELRTDFQIKQALLGAALDCSESLISSWESLKGTVLPNEERLKSYATFFSTRRSISGPRPRLLREEELESAERDERDRLERELMKLRAAEAGATPLIEPVATVTTRPQAPDPWRFAPGEAIRIVCAEPPETMLAKMPYTDRNNPFYIALYRYSDLDSLLELYGYLNRVNPDSSIEARLDTQMSATDYTQHVVLLGGVDWNTATQYMLEQIRRSGLTQGMPVEQRGFPDDDATAPDSGFYVDDKSVSPPLVKSFKPHLVKKQGDTDRLVEDVGHFFRGPNPVNPQRTVTICNGMYGRGVLGAVLALTRYGYRQPNADYIKRRFGASPAYSILTRVKILGGEVATPDWTDAGNILHEWSPPAA